VSLIKYECPCLETRRLNLRAITVGDLDSLKLLYHDEMTYPYLKRKMMREEKKPHLLFRGHKQSIEEINKIRWGISLKTDNVLIGEISLYNIEEWNSGTVGYRLRHEFWNNGYVTEALMELVEYAFQTMGLVRLEATVVVENFASIRVLEKCGFIKEKLMQNEKFGDTYCDYYLYTSYKLRSKSQNVEMIVQGP